jgi:hypothetical protein
MVLAIGSWPYKDLTMHKSWLISTGLAIGLCGSALASGAAPSLRTDEQAFVNYTVKPGDTLNRFLSQYTLPTADRAEILRTNGLTNQHRIPVGMVLRFARADLQFRPAMAKVMALSCEQDILSGNPPAALRVGSDVTEGAVIRVPADCQVSLAIEDGSVIRLPSSATLQFTALRINALESVPEVRLDLQRGRVEVNVKKNRSTGTPFEVNTPKAVMGVRGTEFRVGYDPDGDTAQVEVLTGTVAAQGGQDNTSQDVVKGFGVPFDKTGQSLGLEALLPAPAFVSAQKINAKAPAQWVNFESMRLAKAYVVDSASTVNLSGVRYSQVVQQPRVAVGRLDENAVFYQFAAISESGLLGQTRQYGFCQPINSNERCNAVFDVPLANGIPMTIALTRQVQGQSVPVIKPHTIEAKNGRFLVQGLPMGRYEWVLSYPLNQSQVVQTGAFDLQVLTAQTP